MNDTIESNHRNHNGFREKRERSMGGIKFFKGSPLPDPEERKSRYRALSLERLREAHKVWRPEETLEAAELFFSQGRVNIVGSPQSGKGTILFGLSEICDAFDWGYLFVDGHHQETPASQIVDAITEAQTRRVPIFFDSFDYLFAVSRKLRTIPITTQEERTPVVVDALVKATVPVAITHHDEQWAELFLNKDLRSRFRSQVEAFPTYEIPDSFRSPQSINRFLIDQGIPAQEAAFLANFAWEQPMLDRFKGLFPNSFQTLFTATASFPVLKEVARDNKAEFLPLLTAIAQTESPVDDNTLAKFADVILEADNKRINLAATRWAKGKR